jgi:dehydrogenase/reductase SDR family member 12
MTHRAASSRGDALDRLLEASVVGSFTRIGIALRRRVERWDDLADAGRGRTVLVTGGNSGLGLATATGLLARGAHVIVTTRDATKAEQTREHLVRTLTAHGAGADRADIEARIDTEILDLDRLASVRAFAERLSDGHPLDAVVHNAGAMFAVRSTTEDDLERTYQVHVVAPFLLTMLLIPRLVASPDPRVVWVSSGGMYTERLVVRRIDSPRGYRPAVAYARAKRAQVELSRELQRRLGDRTGVAFHAMHPGWARTPGLTSSLPAFSRIVGPLLRTPEQGADTVLHLLLAQRSLVEGGLFWADRRPRPTDRLARTIVDDTERSALWERLMTDARIVRPEGPA